MLNLNNNIMRYLMAFVAIVAYYASSYASEMLPEDWIWNYTKESYLMDNLIDSHEVNFKIMGTREIDGVIYQVFSNLNESEQSYIRQEDGKVYLYLTDELRCQCEGDLDSSICEIVLYDISAEEGDRYTSISFDETGSNYWTFAEVTVTSKSLMIIEGEEFVCQTVEYSTNRGKEYNVVEGIGISCGRLDRPQCAYLTSGMSFTYYLLHTVTDVTGKIIFDGKEFTDNPCVVENVEHSQAEKLEYCNGKIISNQPVLVCDLLGNVIAIGSSEVQLLGFPSGTYIAKTRQSSLKIFIK